MNFVGRNLKKKHTKTIPVNPNKTTKETITKLSFFYPDFYQPWLWFQLNATNRSFV
jgi:hypothetical protein